jgi:ABC-type arginine transport system permease subunit
VEILDMFSLMLETALVNPASGISLMVIIAGFRLFSNTPSKHYNNIAGFLHGVAHVLGLFLIYWGATRWTVWGLGLEPRSTEQLLLSVPLIFLGGAMVGSLLMACYLAISYNLFGHHQNEAFSALRLKDWKNFLRLKLTPDSVTIYPVGFPRVARAWEPNPSAGGPARWPEDPEGCRPILIEEPVVMSFK